MNCESWLVPKNSLMAATTGRYHRTLHPEQPARPEEPEEPITLTDYLLDPETEIFE